MEFIQMNADRDTANPVRMLGCVQAQYWTIVALPFGELRLTGSQHITPRIALSS